jgi:hypothetical protein
MNECSWPKAQKSMTIDNYILSTVSQLPLSSRKAAQTNELSCHKQTLIDNLGHLGKSNCTQTAMMISH